MSDKFKKSDPSHDKNITLSPILQKLCFPESPSFLIHLLLFPYRYLFINVGSNHLLNFLLNPKKSLLDYFSVIMFGGIYFFIIWGGMFGLLGLFLAAPIFPGPSLEIGFGLIGLPFMILGMILGVYVLKVRYNFYKTSDASNYGAPKRSETQQKQEQEQIRWELGSKHDLQLSLGNKAAILKDGGDLDGAMALYKEKEQICRELGLKDGLAESLHGQAYILQNREDWDGAMALYKEKEQICRELGLKDGLQASLVNQAMILKNKGDLEGATTLLQEQEQICQELGAKDGLQRCYGTQASIFMLRGELDDAMTLLKKKEKICREEGLIESLSFTFINQALILHRQGHSSDARKLADESYQLAVKNRFIETAKKIKALTGQIEG